MQISHESEIRQLLNISLPSKTPINFLDSALALLEKHEFLETNFELALLLERCFRVCIDSKQQAKYNPLLWKICQIYMNDCFGDSAGFWALLHRAVYKKRKILKLTDAQLQELISFFEACKAASTSIHHSENIYRILSDIEDSSEKKKSLALWMIDQYQKGIENDPPLKQQYFLQEAYKIANKIGLHDEKRTLSIALKKSVKEANKQLFEITASTTVPANEIDNYLNNYIKTNFEHSITYWILTGFINYKNEQLGFNKEVSEFPLQYMVTVVRFDNNGRTIAQLPNFFENPEPHFRQYVIKMYQFRLLFRELSMLKILETHQPTVEDFMAFMEQSPCFIEHKTKLLQEIFNSFLEKRYSAFLHLAVPYFEYCIRTLAFQLGINVYYYDENNNGLSLKSLGTLLHEELLIASLGVERINQLKLLFIDELGLNLRNRLCHGMMDDDDFNSKNALIVIDSILTLGLWRLEKAVE
jgi:hypothetical protein